MMASGEDILEASIVAFAAVWLSKASWLVLTRRKSCICSMEGGAFHPGPCSFDFAMFRPFDMGVGIDSRRLMGSDGTIHPSLAILANT